MASWHKQIDEATSPREVVAVTRDFLATWTPEELVRLPVQCRPGRIRDESDIVDLHAALADEYRTTRATGDQLTALQVITALMVRALLRIAELAREDSAPIARRPSDSSRL